MSADVISPDEVREALRDYFADQPGVPRARRMLEAADQDGADGAVIDRAAWSTLASQLGLAALGAPEEWGGTALGLPHLVAAAEECGATLEPGPVRAALVLAASLTGIDPATVPDGLAAGIRDCLAGVAIPGLAVLDDDTTPEFAQNALNGRIVAATHGEEADLVIAVARSADGPVIVIADVRTTTPRSPLVSRDGGLALAEILADHAPAVVVAAGEAGVARHRDLARLLLAAEQVGGASGCLSAMVDYALIRQQFGQLIGSYQAIQHRCAETTLAVAATRALVAAAAAATDAGDDAAARQLCLLARADAGEAFTRAADGYIQVSGGIGFTWEHDAHLFFRRSRATAALGGATARHRHAAIEAGCLDLLLAAGA